MEFHVKVMLTIIFVQMVKNILEESVAERFAKAFDGADKEGDAETPVWNNTMSMLYIIFFCISIVPLFPVCSVYFFSDFSMNVHIRFASSKPCCQESRGSLSHVLRVGTELLEDIGLVAGHVAQCFPPRHDIFSFYESRYQKWLYTRLLHSTSDLHALSPGELLDCIRWIHDYRLRIKGIIYRCFHHIHNR